MQAADRGDVIEARRPAGAERAVARDGPGEHARVLQRRVEADRAGAEVDLAEERQVERDQRRVLGRQIRWPTPPTMSTRVWPPISMTTPSFTSISDRLAPADARHRTDQVLALARRQDRRHVLQDRRRVRDRIGGKQQVVEAALEQHLAHRIGVDGAVDADDAAEPGQEKAVAERQVEFAEDRGGEREAALPVRQPRVEDARRR